MSQTPTTFLGRITYPGGVYWLKTQELPVGGSATFDIRAIRDQHVRDRYGKVLPAVADHGQFRWSVIDAKDASHLIGRIAIVSRADGVSSSYSCQVCCPDSYWTGVLGPDNINVPVGGVSGYTVREDLQDCYGNDAGLVDRFASSWSVQFPSVTSAQSTGTGTGQASGLSGGSSTIAGHWNTSYYESSEFTHECFQFTTTADAPGNVETLTPTYVSVIGTPRHTQGPPAPYVFIVNRQVLDQHHNPLKGGAELQRALRSQPRVSGRPVSDGHDRPGRDGKRTNGRKRTFAP